MFPEGWLQPAGPLYLLWIPFSINLIQGGVFGLWGGALVRRLTSPDTTGTWSRSGMLVDLLLGGTWWNLSAVMPSSGFPFTLMRSLGGAFLIAAIYEGCLAIVRKTIR
jgi:hypothetical protein